MALFNFIETFFFISLAITFLLILLLVYHFKQRLGNTEQKCDSMFEIVNNIVKELNILRNAQLNISPPQFSTNHPCAPHIYNKNVHVLSPNIQQPSHNNPSTATNRTDDLNNIYVSIVENKDVDNNINVSELKTLDDEDEYDTSDYYEDSADDDTDDDTDDDIDDDEIIIEEITEKWLNKTDVEIDLPSVETENIKIINMDIDEIVNIDEQAITPPEIIQVEKLENTDVELADVEDNENDRENDREHDHDTDHNNNNGINNSTIEQTKEVYRKMNLHTLKTMVITKGLSSDPSKLKKPELIKLLETITE